MIRSRGGRLGPPLLLVGALLVGWEAYCRMAGVSPIVLPSPSRILEQLWLFIVAPIVGVYMLVYAFGLWTRKAWALLMGVAYAVFATLNVVLFPLLQGLGEMQAWQYGVFGILAIGVPWAAVLLLY